MVRYWSFTTCIHEYDDTNACWFTFNAIRYSSFFFQALLKNAIRLCHRNNLLRKFHAEESLQEQILPSLVLYYSPPSKKPKVNRNYTMTLERHASRLQLSYQHAPCWLHIFIKDTNESYVNILIIKIFFIFPQTCCFQTAASHSWALQRGWIFEPCC